MKPLYHAQASVKRYGGTVEDWLPIHDWLDSSKAHVADIRHRALLHSSFGIYLAEQCFGPYVEVEGKKVPTRQIAEEHVMEDLGQIPSVERWLQHLPIEAWMTSKQTTKKRVIPHAD